MTTRHCALCGKDLDPMTPEQEAAAQKELRRQWDVTDPRTCEIVCTPCYKRIVAWWKNGKGAVQ